MGTFGKRKGGQRVSQVALVVKNLPANAGDVRDAASIPGSGRYLKEEMAVNSSILAWRVPWTEEPGGLQSMGSQRVGHACRDLAHREGRGTQSLLEKQKQEPCVSAGASVLIPNPGSATFQLSELAALRPGSYL